MTNLNIEDYLHLIQGVDMKVELLSVECLNVNSNSNYVAYPKASDNEGTAITITSKIVLGYEVGFNISLLMDSYFSPTALPLNTASDLIDTIQAGDFKLMATRNAASPSLHLFEIKNPQVMVELKRIYPNIRDLACRDNFAWVANERLADKIINEYKMALILNPFKQSCYFEESLRIALHEGILSNAIALLSR